MTFIRLFHALHAPFEPLTVSVCPAFRREGLLFGELTDYHPCPSGFHAVTVIGSKSRRVFLQKTLPFFTPDAFTLALVNGSRGMDFLLVPDYPCFSDTYSSPDFACLPTLDSASNFACLRTVNLTTDPMRYHLYRYGERLLFSDVWFREVTCHRRISPGKHGLYLALTDRGTPLIPSVFEAQEGQAYTGFVYGSLSEDTLSILVQKDTPHRDEFSV